MEPEEAYFKDILPEIGNYVFDRDSNSFESGEIAEGLGKYSADEVEDTLDYIAGREDIRHLERSSEGNWRFLAFEPETWETVDERLEKNQNEENIDLPELRDNIRNLSAQEYGKLRNNLEEVYEGLTEVKENHTSYFKAKDLREKVSDVRGPEIGLVLSGLATAGLIKKYQDRDNHEPESIDTDRIRSFKEAIESIESFDDFKELVNEEKD